MLDMLASGDSQAIMDRFNGQHQVTYGYQLTGRAVQIVNLRVTAIGMMPALPWPRPGARLPAQPLATRRVLLPGCEQRESPIYRFDDLAPGQPLSETAVVEYAGSTLLVAPVCAIEFDAIMTAHGVASSAVPVADP